MMLSSRVRSFQRTVVATSALGIAMTMVPATQAEAASSIDKVVTSWVANSAHGGGYNDPESRWVQHDVYDTAVSSNGTVFAAAPWEEGTAEVGVYRDGKVVGRLADTHGWGRSGGKAVAVDSAHVYQAMEQSAQSGIDYPASGTWYGFRRYSQQSLKDVALPANGRSRNNSMRVVSTSAPVTALAATSSEVYAAVAGENKVRVYSTTDFREVRSFDAPAVTKLALDPSGDLWAISAGQVRRYSPTGQQRSSITGIESPSAITVERAGRLLIATDGPRQQVLIYDVTSTPREIGTIGVQGGMFAAPRGTAGPGRFNGIVGLGVDASGNVYIANGLGGDGSDIRKLSAGTYQQQWQLLGLAFVDNADVDPTNPNVVYTSRDRFELDYSKPAGQQWVWKAHTVDRFAHPDDQRSKDTHHYVSPDVVTLGGKKFVFQTGMYQATPRFYRFDGEIAVPSTSFPTNGWGWNVDAKGDVWNATERGGIRRYPFQGIDGAGNPVYGAAVTTPMPSQFQSLQRAQYDAATDTMYLAGWTTNRPRPGGNDLEKLLGSEVLKFSNWSKGNRNPDWRTVLPFSRIGADIRTLYGQIGMSTTADFIFTVEMGTSKVRAYRTSDGTLAKEWTPGPEVGSFVGVVDIPDGITASRLPDGTYNVFVEEDHAGKVLMYRLREG